MFSITPCANIELYTSNIRSLLLYGAPAWHSILTSTSKDKLELVQGSASRIIYPDLCHEERLALLSLPLLNNFIFSICANHFKSISAIPNHPPFNRFRDRQYTEAIKKFFPIFYEIF